jgi:uncharacterized protein YbjT (DUF2867 family)
MQSYQLHIHLNKNIEIQIGKLGKFTFPMGNYIYNIIKPSIVFGENDNFFNLFTKMAKISPFLPLIGGGKAKFAPIYVEDLVNSIALLAQDNKKYKNKIFESYGPNTPSFKELM